MIKNSVILFLLFITSFTSYGQYLSSPNVTKMIERGIIPVSGFTGQAKVEIPLYTVGYKDISVPLGLSYDTRGNKVKQHPGFVGLGWNMMGGGVIYRKVVGMKDEHGKNFTNGSFNFNIGYYYNAEKVANDYNNPTAIKNFAYDGGSGVQLREYAYDASPDEFYFNFNGYSGVFYITNKAGSGSPELTFFCNGDYTLKGEIMEIKERLEFDDSPESSSSTGMNKRTSLDCIYGIKITDDLGNQFVFGGDVNNIEFTNSGRLYDDRSNIATSWHLSKINHVNGYSVDFEYERKGRLIIPDTYRDVVIASGSEKFKSYAHIILAFSLSWGKGNYRYYGNTIVSSFSFIYPSYLKKIKTPLQEITFQYSASNELSYDLTKYHYPSIYDVVQSVTLYSYNDRIRSYWQKLDQITVSGLNKVIKLRYREQRDLRLRLDKVEEGVVEGGNFYRDKEYFFAYNKQLLPDYESKKVDHWGFFNGVAYAYNANYFQSRHPNAEYLQAEMLERIYYPGQGFTDLEYEAHTFSSVAHQFPFVVRDTFLNSIAGGLRIKSVFSDPGDGSVPKKIEYFYTTDYIKKGTTSSGVLAGVPRYSNSGTKFSSYKSGDFWSGRSGSSELYYQRGRDKNFFPMGFTRGAHVTYTEVTEKINDGYLRRIFSNHDNGYMDKSPLLFHANFDSEAFEDPFISWQGYRGLELRSEVYDNTRTLQQQTVNTYAIPPLNSGGVPFIQRIEEGAISGVRASSGMYPVQTPVLKSAVIKELKDGQMIETLNARFKNLQLLNGDRNTAINKSNLTSYVKEIKASYVQDRSVYHMYPFEYKSSNQPYTGGIKKHPYRLMKSKNMLSYPVRITSNKTKYDFGVGDSIKSNLVREEIIDYGIFGNIIAPSVVYTMDFNENVSDYVAPKLVAGDFDNSGLFKEKIVVDSRAQKKKEFIRYDIYGNVLESRDGEGVATAYIWGYCGQYLLAEIKNCRYGDVISILGNTTLNSLNNANVSQAVVEAALELLRADGRLKKALIDSYVHHPLIGLKYKKDARGNATHFAYDRFHRLSSIKDHEGNLLEVYNYNNRAPKFVNRTISKSIQKNDCPQNDYKGSEVLYTVPAGRYTSSISLADAERQAEQEIAERGQAYANQHGKCIALSTLVIRNGSLNKLSGEVRLISLTTGASRTINFYIPPRKNIHLRDIISTVYSAVTVVVYDAPPEGLVFNFPQFKKHDRSNHYVFFKFLDFSDLRRVNLYMH